MIKLKDILLENPDKLNINNNQSLRWDDEDAIVFGMYHGKMLTMNGEGINSHGDFIDDPTYDEYLPKKGKSGRRFDRYDFDYPGRLWENSKIISFWDYPPQNEMRRVINLLEKETGLNIWNRDWRLEVILDENSNKYKTKFDTNPFGVEYKGNFTILIPIVDYTGSEEQIGKELDHIVSPMKKKQKITPSGIGSEKDSNNLPAKVNFYSRKGLGDGVVKLKQILLNKYNKWL